MSHNILYEIAEKTKERIAEEKKKTPLAVLREKAEACNNACEFPFETALKSNGISVIAEVKKASPSKGIICSDFNPAEIAVGYETAGADAVSVLTEPFYFKGADEYLTDIKSRISIPVLRKDFTVDSYMIYGAKAIGADAVLLICTILDDGELREYIEISHSLGLSALVETHDEYEIERALEAGGKIIGVNNRDLKTFDVDINLSEKLRAYVPNDIVFVSESGIRNRNDIERLECAGVNAVLIGETLMRSGNPDTELRRLKGETK